MRTMRFLKVMIERTEELLEFVESNTREESTNPFLVATRHTYEATFGRVWFGSNAEENADAAVTIEKQIGNAKKLVAALEAENSPIWEFYCNDNYLHKEDPYGNALGEWLYWNDRDGDRGGQIIVNFHGLQGSCQDSNGDLMAFLEPFEDIGLDTITICQQSMNKFTGEHLSDLAEMTYDPDMHFISAKLGRRFWDSL
ncbi:uncharacterized protein ATNIH1004_006852 [Aspergillus tanneri]|uniref:Uncharacterized protein n=1 Tax=Aspergillus tanneri TaxID=1220188 RepID=A0A5M9MKC8_9EURO|nr:uncharacterized protein ATNIH1004_006852 [Aspergillus tanneri]KAA8645433.1 hypothetical protein ATNIH1004_006852 [Aspergillus tanneri]